MTPTWTATSPSKNRGLASARTPLSSARFLHEARITGRLQHPGIVPVYELVSGNDGQPPFYTMRSSRARP